MVGVDPLIAGIIGIVALLILLASGMHIALSLGIVGAVGSAIVIGLAPASSMLANTFFYSASKFVFTIIPLFVLMGLLASESGTTKGIYDAISYWTGHSKAGLGIATVIGCAAFGTICGSSMVTSAVFAKVAAPEMRARGYEKSFAYGICSAAGTIGMLIPPSILIVLYAILADESVGRLLIGGVAPGLLLTIIFSLGIWMRSRTNPNLIRGSGKIDVTWKQRFTSLVQLWPVVVVGLIVFVGIFAGVFTPTEAGAIAAAVMVVLASIVAGGRRWSVLAKSLQDTAGITAMVFLILCGAGMFSHFMAISGVAQTVLKTMISWNMPPLQFVAAMCVVYLIMGCFLDSLSMFAITIPIVYPVVKGLGIDPIWYGMSVILAVHIGLITPPVGMDVYGVKAVAPPDVTLEDCFRGVGPFVVMMLIALAIVILFPIVSTALPALMFD